MLKRLILIALFFIHAGVLTASDLTVIVTGAEVGQGRIYVGLFNDSEEFPWGKQQKGQFTDSSSNKLRVVFTDLKSGNYAVVAFQDKKPDEKLNLNFLGIPTEKYGISGRKVFGEPSFKEAGIKIDSQDHQINIILE